MARFLRKSALLVLCGFLGAMAYGQEAGKKEAESGKEQVKFSDDFQRDSRSQYQMQGPVKWERGKLTVEDGGILGKSVQAGARAQLTLHLDFPKLSRNGQKTEFWFRFGVKDGNATSVMIRQQRAGGKTTSDVAIMETRDVKQPGGEKEKPTLFIVRHVTGLEGLRPKVLKVGYRYGLVTITADKAEIALGSVNNGSQPIEYWVVQSRFGKLGCHRFDFSSTPRPPALTREQQVLLQEARKLDSDVGSLHRSGKTQQALEAARRVTDIRKRALGELHPHYATSLNNLALLYKSLGNYAEAEPLYLRARDIRKKVLGESHPAYALSLNNLAELHRGRGDYAKAEPLYIQAREIWKKVLGNAHPDYAISLNNLALLYGNMGDYAKAEPLYVQARDIWKKALGEAHPTYAKSLNNLAELYRSMGNYTKAEPLLVQVRAIFKKALGEAHPAYATSLNNLAGLYDNMGEYAKAEPLYLQARDITKKTLSEAHPHYADSLNNLAGLYFRMGDYTKAEGLYVRARDITKKALGAAHPDYARSLNNLAVLYDNMGEYAKAEPLYLQARDIAKKMVGEGHPDYALSLSNLAGLYNNMGEYAKAEALLVQARDITKKALGEAHPDYALSLNNLAFLYHRSGDYAKSEPLYVQARDITRKARGATHPRYATSVDNLALLYQSMGEYTKAEPLYVRARNIRKQVLSEAHPDYAASLQNLAALYESMGDYVKAEPLYIQALGIFRKAQGEVNPDYATTLNNLAYLYGLMGEYAKAEPLYLKARDIRKKVLGEAHPDYALSLNNLAVLYYRRGENAKAEPLFVQARSINVKALGEAHPRYATSLHNLALLYESKGDYAKAEPLFVQARDIKNKALGETHPDYAVSLNHLASLYWRSGDYAKAEPLFRRGLEIKRQHLELTFAAQSRRQQLVRSAALRTTLDAYLSLVRRAKVADADAYRHALLWKGAVFARQGVARQLRDDSATSKLFAQLQQVSGQLAKQSFAVPTPKTRQGWLERIETLTEQKHKLEVELSRRSAEFRRSQALSRLTPAELQQGLPEGTALVDFLEYTRFQPSPKSKGGFDRQRHLLAFVVPSQGEIQRIEFGPHEPIAAAIQRWRKAVEAKRFADRKTALELRRLLWTPLAKHLQVVKTVLISPDGALNRFPFAALPGAKPATYLIEERAIAVVPVPQLLPQLLAAKPVTQGKPQEDSLLLVGDVDYGQSPGKAGDVIASRSAPGGNREGPLWDFQMLDHTGTEIVAIGKSFGRAFESGTVRRLRRGSATESAFRDHAPKHRWLHLATHGYFAPPRIKSALAPKKDEGQPHSLFARQGVTGFHPGLLSGLALTGANTPPKEGDDDGILTALEVAAIDLRGTELAVLSACHTGLGQVAAGEGVLGLQRAFQVSGARTTVTSLWQVDDLATKELMVRFYGNLWNKKQPKLEALRETQLWMIRNGKKFLQDEYRRQGRGARDLVRVTDDQPKTDRLPPYYWASFILSGDWR